MSSCVLELHSDIVGAGVLAGISLRPLPPKNEEEGRRNKFEMFTLTKALNLVKGHSFPTLLSAPHASGYHKFLIPIKQNF